MLQKFQSSAGYGLPSGHTRLSAHTFHEAALFLLLFNGWFKINWGRNYLLFQVFLFQYFGFTYGNINFATLLLSRDKWISLKKNSSFLSLSVMHNWEAFLGMKWLEAWSLRFDHMGSKPVQTVSLLLLELKQTYAYMSTCHFLYLLKVI